MATHRLRVLILDPAEDAADFLGLTLTQWGYDVRVAYTPAQALKIADDYRPHVVLIDPASCESDAAAVAAQLRGRAVLVAVTARGDTEHRKRWIKAGFSFMALKPAASGILQPLLEAMEKGMAARADRPGAGPHDHEGGSNPGLRTLA